MSYAGYFEYCENVRMSFSSCCPFTDTRDSLSLSYYLEKAFSSPMEGKKSERLYLNVPLMGEGKQQGTSAERSEPAVDQSNGGTTTFAKSFSNGLNALSG